MKNRTVMHLVLTVALFGGLAVGLSPVFAAEPGGRVCNAIAGILGGTVHQRLTRALNASVFVGGVGGTNGGFDLNMWATIVDRNGIVCAVTRTGGAGDQWPGSRVISAQKANTANAFSIPGLALSTANLWAATQPGGSLFGLQFSNPVDPAVAYGANDNSGVSQGAEFNIPAIPNYGLVNDPLVGKFVGGVNVFGGGLALYSGRNLLGALGVSGDTSCADHNIAWRTREFLPGFGVDNVPGGVGPNGKDGINYDVTGSHNNFQSKSGFGHPECGLSGKSVAKEIGSGG